ncbi:tyrosine-type recombinase/integrase [Neorhizobium galegae]|uniref:Tyrosine-type recombinase/integrase n=1 Tax=Neorhizobium galegae TaxID=399 RepID=A0A6A1TRJ9_NEOGA|nr:tyrosine-type recombinase/integrase [Neorhizobium galegae]KAB1086194.1 tyrosine-type recombinase/integrase [Neorhizobium galegae]
MAMKSSYTTRWDTIGKALVAIVEGDLDTVRNNIVTRCKRRVEAKIEAAKKAKKEIVIGNEYGHRAANLTVAALRSAFKYFKMWPEIYGLKSNVAAGLENTQDRPPNSSLEADSGSAIAAMSQYDLGAYIYGLEQIKNPIVQTALFLQLETGQRRFTACAAVRESFQVSPHYGFIWRLRDKVDHWRLLPLTEKTAERVKATLERYKDYGNRYLFPVSKRMGEDGEPVQGHVNKRTLSAAIESMRHEGGVFEGHPNPPSSHDARYAFVTRMGQEMHRFVIDGRRLQFRDIEIITHANEGKEGTASLIYDRSQALDVKEILLSEWREYLLEGYRMYCEGLKDPIKRAEYQTKSVELRSHGARPVLVVDNVDVEVSPRRAVG